MKRVALLLVLFICCFCSAQVYKYINVENGLSNRMVYSIKKDKKGYMWFLTHDGIDRFDGKLFKHYKLVADGIDINSFADVNQLYTDTTGCMWEIGKDGHIFKYNTSTDSYQFICKLNKQHNEDWILNYSYIDKDNNIWLCTTDKQYIYNIDSHKLIRITTFHKKSVTNVIQIGPSLYCVGTLNGVYIAKLESNKLKPVPQPELDTLPVQVNALFYHQPTRKLYIGSFLKGLFVYDFTNHKLIHPNAGLEDININCIIALNNDEVLIATDGAGVYKINAHSLIGEPYIAANYNEPNGMNGNNISDIYVDEEQRIWMANYPMGITLLNNRYPTFKWIKHSIGNKQSLINDQVNSIIEDSDGDIWYATNNGISIYHTQTNTWTNMLSSFHSDGYNKNHIFITLCEVSPGVVWTGGYTSGMYWINKKDMKPYYFVPSLFQKDIHPDKYIRAIHKDKKGDIWVGGYYNLKRINIETKTIEAFKGIHSINVIAEKDSAHLWVGCIDGLFLLNKRNKSYKQIKLPVKSSHINVIYQSNDGTLYIGTNSSGLVVYNTWNNKFTVYHKDNCSLISNSIYSILSDKKGSSLVVSTENSLSRFNVENRTFSNWTSEQGLMTSHFNATSGTYTSKKTFLFGSGDGAVEFDVNTHIPKDYRSKLVFNEFMLFGQPVYTGEKDSPLTKDIDDIEKIDLRSDQNTFSLRLSSINYDYPSNVLYSWKLDGFFNKWNKPGTENLVRYTSLIPGKYKLFVRAISKEDQHTIEEKELNITIHPPLWATVWAMFIYICATILIGWAVLRYLFMRKERKASGEKINFFVNTAHDIRTPLTLIKAPLDDLQEYEKLSFKGGQNLQMAIRNANNLYNLVSNLIDFEKVDMYSDTLYPDEHELRTYLEDVTEQFLSHADSKKIKFSLEINFTYTNVWFDKSKMDAILKNLIVNAIKYTPENGSISVCTNINKDNWTIEIKDTGIGIPSKEQKKIFNQIFRASNAVNSNITGSGIGLMLVHKLVELHNGKIALNSTEGEGATFKLTFPSKKRNRSSGNLLKKRTKDIRAAKQETTEVTEQNPATQSNPAKKKEKQKLNPDFARVVVIEDHDELRTYLDNTLSEDYSVFTAANGQEGLETIKAVNPDLVISDIMMPIMNGEELCRKLKSDIETSHIPIILLTAKATRQDVIHGLENKADRYLPKPFDLPVLRATIKSVLDNYELLKKKFSQTDVKEPDYKNCTNLIDFQFMAKMNNIIDKHMNEAKFSVDTLAEHLNMSRTSCYNKIKALTDQSPIEYITEARLKKAVKLLMARENTITEIADIVGFGDAKYFREVFKKKFGVSPSQYAEGGLPPTDESTEKIKE